MSMYRKFLVAVSLAGLLLVLWPSAAAQQSTQASRWQDPASVVRLSLPPGVPLTIASSDLSDTEIYPRGGALVIDLRCSLVVRNTGTKTVRGVTFAVLAQQITAGGKASVAVPSLNVAPGESFPVRLSLRLLRPLPGPANPLVEVTADGVLFDDFGFAGPDQLDSRRKMTVWEMEANRDRHYFKSVLRSQGPEQLQREILASFDRQTLRPRLEVRLAGGRVTSSATRAVAGERVALAFLDLADSPLELVSGAAEIDGASAGSPQIRVKNRSPKPVRYFELGWLVQDAAGTRYAAGSVPAPTSELHLVPGESLSTRQQRRFAFVPKSAELGSFAIGGMGGYVSQVQFEDGSFWIPSRAALEQAALMETLPVSAEEQRLTDLYRQKGLQALINELNKF